MGGADPLTERDSFFVVVWAIQKHWQSSLQPSLPRSLQKGHLIANNVMQQKGSFGMPGKRKNESGKF